MQELHVSMIEYTKVWEAKHLEPNFTTTTIPLKVKKRKITLVH